ETSGRLEALNTLEARILAEQLIIENAKVAIHDPTAALDSATYAEKATQLQELITDATYKYMYGSIDLAGFNSAIEDWKSRGGQQMIDEFNAAYKQ
ncbi:MAG TPA: ABC transporter substrate-binding protein, partial [Candidatus Paenibacillus intestinavium]|nr:ABC transporter substrate-binding protein [Candidatus Paenibacillus intestinavium]